MTRKEEIEKASIEYQMSISPVAIGGAAFADEVEIFNINSSFVAGANWQKEQIMKDAVDADAVYMTGEGTLFNPEVLPDNIKPGDKVKLIIVKEEEI